MKHKTFVLSTDQHELVNMLTREQKGDVLDALFQYAETGEKPQLDKIPQVVFLCICKDIDRLWEKYDKICAKRSEAGRKGGAPKGNANAKKHVEDEEEFSSDNSTKNNQMLVSSDNSTKNNQNGDNQIKQPYNDNDNDNIILPNGSTSTLQVAPPTPDIVRPTKKVRKDASAFDFAKLADYWNERMRDRQIPSVNSISGKRKTHITARAEEYGVESIWTVIDKASASSFLNGSNQRAWVATFDWVFLPTNFPKVLEGNYDNRPAGSTSRAAGAASIIAKLKQYERRRSSEVTATSSSDYEGAF